MCGSTYTPKYLVPALSTMCLVGPVRTFHDLMVHKPTYQLLWTKENVLFEALKLWVTVRKCFIMPIPQLSWQNISQFRGLKIRWLRHFMPFRNFDRRIPRLWICEIFGRVMIIIFGELLHKPEDLVCQEETGFCEKAVVCAYVRIVNVLAAWPVCPPGCSIILTAVLSKFSKFFFLCPSRSLIWLKRRDPRTVFFPPEPRGVRGNDKLAQFRAYWTYY